MRRQLTNKSNFLNKYNTFYEKKDGFVEFQYNEVDFNYLSCLFDSGKKIYFDKNKDNFKILVNESDLVNQLNDSNKTDIFIRIINMFNSCNSIKISLKKDSSNILVDLFSSQYCYVFDNCLVRKDNYYLLSDGNIESLEHELSIYNELLGEIEINITQKIVMADFSMIKNFYDQNDNCKIVVFNNNTNIDLILVSKSSVKFVFDNKGYFEKVILPEILKLYSNDVKVLDMEKKIKKFNKMFYSVNNSFFLLNFYDEMVEYNVNFLHDLVLRKRHQLELNQNIVIDLEIDIDKYNDSDEKVMQKNYSYGYVNILLISLVLSFITIVVCLLKI